MKPRPTMRAIIIKGPDDIKAAEAAKFRSLKSGKAAQMVKEASLKPRVVQENVKR